MELDRFSFRLEVGHLSLNIFVDICSIRLVLAIISEYFCFLVKQRAA